MKLVTFTTANGSVESGIVVGDQVYTVEDLGYADAVSLMEAMTGSSEADSLLHSAQSSTSRPFNAVKLHPPIPNPPRIFGIGLNYLDHAAESKMQVQKVPTVFLKLPQSMVGQDADVILPRNSNQVDYEAELAVVIGKGGYRIPPEDWQKHVFGYTVLNDVSARDIQLATTQWNLGKSFPTFTPVGPWIVSADEIPDPHELAVRLTIDGEVMQDANTRDLIFRIPQLIEYISSIVPLLPGDIISTGTPPGVGLGRSPQRWLQPGEQVSISIQGIGELRNIIAAES